MSDRYGASEEAWRHFSSTLGLTANLLPVVSNPNAPISSGSAMKGLGKTPSRYNSKREAVGIKDWTNITISERDVAGWMKEPDYGICVRTAALRAIDYDAHDTWQADELRKLIGEDVPIRRRDGTAKMLIPFRYVEPLTKHVIPVGSGIIEVLADGQQFVAEGTHPDGSRYEWEGDWSKLPTLDALDFQMLLHHLKAFATGEVRIARERRAASATDLPVHDDVVDWLIENWETYDVGSRDELQILCPFADEHTSDTGPSSTAYFPAGTGGYQQGHFVCLHAHCTGRDDSEYLWATGYSVDQFEALPDTAPVQQGVEGDGSVDTPVVDGEKSRAVAEAAGLIPWPKLKRDAAGAIEPTATNMVLMVGRSDIIGREIAFDIFRDELVWAPMDTGLWRTFTDVDYIDVRMVLEARGMKPMGKELMRECIHRVAYNRQVDVAQLWLQSLIWDGVERIGEFAIRGWGWADTPYSRAVGRYVWTAMAARVFDPGCQADMAPILVGPQGKGKTSAIKAMVPDIEFYATLQLSGHEADNSRLMRGTLVAELEELRGLNSRAVEEIKAWITRTHETWVPKFKEFKTKFGRRCIFFGSTNDDDFLNDPTGERRWLPGRCGPLDIDWIRANRDQLWAEGAAMYRIDGMAWEEVSELATAEHHEFKATDPWEASVERWLDIEQMSTGTTPAQDGKLRVSDVLSGAVNIMPQHQDRASELRMARVLRGLGWERKKIRIEGEEKPKWGFTKEE